MDTKVSSGYENNFSHTRSGTQSKFLDRLWLNKLRLKFTFQIYPLKFHTTNSYLYCIERSKYCCIVVI